MIKPEMLQVKKYRFLNTTLLAVAFIITVVSIVTGSYVHDKENVMIGSISHKRYVASTDMVDTSATNKLIAEAEKSVGPLYKHDTDVQKSTEEKINTFFDDLDALLEKAALDAASAEANGVESNVAPVYNNDAVFKIPVVLSEKQYATYNELTVNGKESFIDDVIKTANYVLDQGITEESMAKAMELVNDSLRQTQWNAELKAMGYSVISKSLEPNLVLDVDAVQAAKEQKASEVQPVTIMKNQKIVDEGEVITKEIYDILQELNLINQDYSESVIPLIGSIVVVILMFTALFMYFCTQNKKIIEKPNDVIILFMLYVIIVIILRATSGMTNYALIPVSIFAMLVSILVSTRVALMLNVFVTIIGTFIFNGDMQFPLFFIITGTFAALLVQYTEKRKYTLIVGASMGLVNTVAYIAVCLFFQNGYTYTIVEQGLYAGITGVLSVIVAVGSLPFWEAAFEVNTPLKLLELTNPNNELLRRLMIEAPGTYHHSLIVANLAETAAYEVEANATLARVGSYYHDIGKLKYPLYFSENQMGENPHDNIEPYNSAKIIMEHAIYGKILAEEHKLPIAVKNIICEHHGNTFVKYFYYKAVKKYSKDNVKAEDFRYEGPVPQSIEAAIVMLADTVEAAVRSTLSEGKNLEEVNKLIKTLIKDKLDDGQLNECMLTIKDLDTIRKAFLKVFQGMYHDRIAYPKAPIELESNEAVNNESIKGIEEEVKKEK